MNFDSPMTLCSDCEYRATGASSMRPFDGEDECAWCGDTLEGTRRVVEEQEDPGPLPWQESRDDLYEYLDQHEHTSDVRHRDMGLDFTIGDMFEWPQYNEDDHINAIRSSSISLGFVGLAGDVTFDEVKIHLPPTRETHRDSIDELIDTDAENVGLHFGTGALGGMPAPDGVITPHIIGKNLSQDSTTALVKQAIGVYEDVYAEGDEVLQEKP